MKKLTFKQKQRHRARARTELARRQHMASLRRMLGYGWREKMARGRHGMYAAGVKKLSHYGKPALSRPAVFDWRWLTKVLAK